MKYFHEAGKLFLSEPSAVTLGKFDGFHRGHQKLLRDVINSKSNGLKSVVVSFDFSYLSGFNRAMLMTGREKQAFLSDAGIDYFVEIPFTKEIASMEAEFFIEELLLKHLNAEQIICGTDFCFGHGRRGNIHLLSEMSEKYGFEVIVEEKEWDCGREISSSFIREEVLAGNMETAARLLGRPYEFSGIVIHGSEIGRTIGFPTMNILPEERKIIPPFGVYFSRILIDGKTCYGITNIGIKPTVSTDSETVIETHIIDGSGDFYGKSITVQLLSHTRGEKKFESLEALKMQLTKDLADGRKCIP